MRRNFISGFYILGTVAGISSCGENGPAPSQIQNQIECIKEKDIFTCWKYSPDRKTKVKILEKHNGPFFFGHWVDKGGNWIVLENRIDDGGHTPSFYEFIDSSGEIRWSLTSGFGIEILSNILVGMGSDGTTAFLKVMKPYGPNRDGMGTIVAEEFSINFYNKNGKTIKEQVFTQIENQGYYPHEFNDIYIKNQLEMGFIRMTRPAKRSGKNNDRKSGFLTVDIRSRSTALMTNSYWSSTTAGHEPRMTWIVPKGKWKVTSVKEFREKWFLP